MRFPFSNSGIVFLLLVTAASLVTPSGATAFGMTDVTEPSMKLLDGTAGMTVSQGGQLAIDNSKRALVSSPDARYVYGNPDDPMIDRAFVIEPGASKSRPLTVTYQDDSVGADGELQIRLFDAFGTEVGRIGGDSSSVTVNANPPEEKYYAIVVIDTHGMAQGERLTGTLTVTT